jgi:hypothetical protein
VLEIDFNYFITSPDEVENSKQDLSAITEGFFFMCHIIDDVLLITTGPVEELPGRHLTSAE